MTVITYADVLKAISEMEHLGYSVTFTDDNRMIVTGTPKKAKELKEKVQFT